MEQEAIAKAESKLERMRRALNTLKQADIGPEEIEAAWEDFVMASGTFYSTLEQGAKNNKKSFAWFGQKKHDRRADPLLKYIHFARNAEEYGIERITKRASSYITVEP